MFNDGGKVGGGLLVVSGLLSIAARLGISFASFLPDLSRLLSHNYAWLFQQPVLSVVGSFYPASTWPMATTTGFKKGD